MVLKNIGSIKNCYGCGICAVACPKKIITIELNKEGFYEQRIIDEKACNGCGLCISSCAYADDKVMSVGDHQPVSYAAWSNNAWIRAACSSGGIGFEIGQYLIEQGYKACGVRYNAEMMQAEHFIATTVEEFKASIGSKYIQSYTLPGFGRLNRKDKYLVTGTPCHMDSMRRYIRMLKIEEQFILMDFFCHGVPSMLLWRKYLEQVERQTGKILSAIWRDKGHGWHDSWVMIVNGEKKTSYQSKKSDGDLFYRFYLGNLCLNNACYDKCKYKIATSAADIRVGDLWGNAYQKDEAGVSALLIYSKKGKDLIEALTNCTLESQPVSVVAEGQMRHGAKKPPGYFYVKRRLSGDAALSDIARKARLIYISSHIHKIVIKRILRLWKS